MTNPSPDCRPLLRRGLAAVAFLLALGALLPLADADTTPHYPHVVWLEEPAHEATIVWVTETKPDEQTLYYDTRSRDGKLEAYRATAEVDATISEIQKKVYFHHVHLTNLIPSADYYFTVESDGRTTEERYFRTAPDDDRPFTLLYGGDSRSNPESRRSVNRMIRRLFDERDRLLALVHGGDYVMTATIWKQLKSWLEDWQLTTLDSGRLLPIVPARGNHELSPAQLDDTIDNYNALFGMPGGSSRDYWTTHIGSQTAIVNLDTNSSLGGDQRQWLDDQLATLTENRRWIVANYHRPAYPAVKEPGRARMHFTPLFEKYDVDLVCESDGHVLKRTVPIEDGEQSSDGVVYVGEGGLGVRQRSPDADRWYLREPGMTRAGHHVQTLDVGPEELTYEAIVLDEGVVDTATFDRQREGTPVPLEVRGARAPTESRIQVRFSKGLDPDSVDASDVEFDGSPTVASVELHEVRDDTAVVETEEALTVGESYALSVRGVRDLLGNELDESATAEVEFNPPVDSSSLAPVTDGPATPSDSTDDSSSPSASTSRTDSSEPTPDTETTGCQSVRTAPSAIGFLVALLWLLSTAARREWTVGGT